MRRVRKSFERVGTPIEAFAKSRTQQSFVEECDVNNILKRYRDLNALPSSAVQPLFGDFSNLPSYHEAMNVVAQANQAFAALPAELRARFQNDPARYLDFVGDDSNYEEARKLGLVPPKPPAEAPEPQSGGDGGQPPSEGAAAP